MATNNSEKSIAILRGSYANATAAKIGEEIAHELKYLERTRTKHPTGRTELQETRDERSERIERLEQLTATLKNLYEAQLPSVAKDLV